MQLEPSRGESRGGCSRTSARTDDRGGVTPGRRRGRDRAEGIVLPTRARRGRRGAVLSFVARAGRFARGRGPAMTVSRPVDASDGRAAGGLRVRASVSRVTLVVDASRKRGRARRARRFRAPPWSRRIRRPARESVGLRGPGRLDTSEDGQAATADRTDVVHGRRVRRSGRMYGPPRPSSSGRASNGSSPGRRSAVRFASHPRSRKSSLPARPSERRSASYRPVRRAPATSPPRRRRDGPLRLRSDVRHRRPLPAAPPSPPSDVRASWSVGESLGLEVHLAVDANDGNARPPAAGESKQAHPRPSSSPSRKAQRHRSGTTDPRSSR